MELLSILGIIFLTILLILLILGIFLVISDGDLVLMITERFGKPVSSLAGQVAWITGASSGIGESLVYELAQHGVKLVLSARRKDELQRVKTQCIEKFSNVKEDDILVLPMDMLKFEEYDNHYKTVLNHFNKLDIMVHNAGRSQRADWEKIELSIDREMFDLNVFGPVHLTRLILPEMNRRKSGHIVIISSIAGKMGAPLSCTYSGSKFALHGYFDGLRIEKYPSNLNVTLVCPGPVMSNIVQSAYSEVYNQFYEAGAEEGFEKNRMKTPRCAHLIAVSIANKLDEVWISRFPLLQIVYLCQYQPIIAAKLLKSIGLKTVKKLRAGK